VLLVVSNAWSQSTVPVTWKWTKATEGALATQYRGVIQYILPNAPADTVEVAWSASTPDTTFTWNGYMVSSMVRMKVQGGEENDIFGPYSLYSDWFTFRGYPGGPDKPVVIEVGGNPVR